MSQHLASKANDIRQLQLCSVRRNKKELSEWKWNHNHFLEQSKFSSAKQEWVLSFFFWLKNWLSFPKNYGNETNNQHLGQYWNHLSFSLRYWNFRHRFIFRQWYYITFHIPCSRRSNFEWMQKMVGKWI